MSFAYTRNSMRKLLRMILTNDTDIDAFLTDFFPMTKSRCSNGMDTEQKLTLLLEINATAIILQRLVEYDSVRTNQNLGILIVDKLQNSTLADQIPPIAAQKIADYPYDAFKDSFRDIVAPKRVLGSNRVLNLVFGNIATIRSSTVVLPINQDFDFMQRGPRSVLAAFNSVRIEKRNFYDVLEELWPRRLRPSNAGIGHTHYIKLPENSNNLQGVILAVTTRNLSTHEQHYGRYVNTPIEGIDYVIDRVLDCACENNCQTIAIPLIGSGYANVRASFLVKEAAPYMQKAILMLMIDKLESHLAGTGTTLERAIAVIYSAQAQSREEHDLWEFSVKALKLSRDRRESLIGQFIEKISQLV
ncbi:MAG: hypothetical protein JNJ46_25450 [Myxococcales bacterium]|nr:hypothetical protein [Myxococcales bacterium]